MRLLESSSPQKPTFEDPNSRNALIRRVRGRGRCVFARRKIAAGEVIERAPVIVIPKKQWPSVKKSILEDNVYRCRDCLVRYFYVDLHTDAIWRCRVLLCEVAYDIYYQFLMLMINIHL